MKKSKKILVIDFNGTSPTYTHYFSLALKEEGFNVYILGYKNETDLRIHFDQLKYIGLNTKIRILNYFLNWFYLIFNSKSYCAIHIQWLPLLKFSDIDLFFVSWLKRRNRNIYYTVHNVFPHDEKRKAVKRRFKKLYNLLDNIVVNTDETIKTLRKMGINKNFIRINHGLFFKGFNQKTKVTTNKMVMLGRICEYKGFDDAIRALKELKNLGHEFILHIEGSAEEDYFLKLKKRIKNYNLEQNIILLNGYLDVEKLIDLYTNAFVTLMPYKKIEQSGVAFTSLGLNIPIVAYKVGGLNEVIVDKVNGRLVDKDNVWDFRDSILWVFDNQLKLKDNLQNYNYEEYWSQSAKVLIKQYTKKA